MTEDIGLIDHGNEKRRKTMTDNTTTTHDGGPSPAPETRSDMSVGVTARQPRRRHPVLWALAFLGGIILTLMVLGAVLWTLARSIESQTEAFASTVDQIVVEGTNGSVTFEAGSRGEITVEREWLFTDAPEVEIVESEGTLHITGDCGRWCRIHISGTAPAGTGLQVRTDAGSIDVTGLSGGLDLTTSAGSLTVTDVGGPAKLWTDAGWIRGSIVDGDVDARTSAGGIDLEIRGDFAVASAVTDAGSVRLSVPDDVYRVEAETSVGSTDVDVPTDPDASRLIVARSNAGNVSVDRLP
jgi:hypothetical protein